MVNFAFFLPDGNELKWPYQAQNSFQENAVYKNISIRKQTPPQTPSQITSPVSAWYSFFLSPPRKIFRQYPSVTQCLEFPPRVRLQNSLSRRSNSLRVSHKISSPCWRLIKPWPKDRILSSNIEREEGKQFVMWVRGCGNGPQKTSQRTLRLTHSN